MRRPPESDRKEFVEFFSELLDEMGYDDSDFPGGIQGYANESFNEIDLDAPHIPTGRELTPVFERVMWLCGVSPQMTLTSQCCHSRSDQCRQVKVTIEELP